MPDFTNLKDLPINLIIFVIWYFSFKDSQNKWQKQMELQTEFMNKVFGVLSSIIDTSIFQNGMLQKIYTAIENNWTCPYIKGMAGKRHNENEVVD